MPLLGESDEAQVVSIVRVVHDKLNPVYLLRRAGVATRSHRGRVRGNHCNRFALDARPLKRLDGSADNLPNTRYRFINRNCHAIARHNARRERWKLDWII